MSVVLPRDGADRRPESRGEAAAEPIDFGARLVGPLGPVRTAADRIRVDAALATATRALDGFVRALAGSADDVDDWPERFAAEAKRLRDEQASALPDGSARDRFDRGFDLFAKAKALETRRLATHRRIAGNRDALDRVLAAHAQTAATASDPVTAGFAETEAEAAVHNQEEAGGISPGDAQVLIKGFRADVAARRARQIVRDDPDAAAAALAAGKEGPLAGLSKADRAALSDTADRRRTAHDAAERLEAAARDAAATRDRLRTAHAFEAGFAEDIRDRTATPLALEDARDAGLIDDKATARLKAALSDAHDARLNRVRVAEAVDHRLAEGDALDPADPDDRRDADAWVAALLDDLPSDAVDPETATGGEAARRLRHAAARLGFVPPALARRLDLYWRSGEPALMHFAALAGEAGGDNEPDAAGRGAFRDLVAAGLPLDRAKESVAEMRRAGFLAGASDGVAI